MKTKKNKSISAKDLLSNTLFVLKFLFQTNKMLYIVRVPLIIVQASTTFIPIVFTRYILNSIASQNNILETVSYVIAMALCTFIVNIISNTLGNIDQRQVAKTRYLANLSLGRSVMKIQYADLEKPETKSFVGLAQEDSMIYILTLVCNFLSSIIKLIGLSSIVLTFQPLIIFLIAAVIAAKMIIDKRRHKQLEFYRSVWAPINRKTNYILELMRELPYAKEVRTYNLIGWLCEKYNQHFEKEVFPLFRFSEKQGTKLNTFTAITGLIQDCIVYILLAYEVVFKNLTIGDFSMYMTSINNFSSNVAGVFWNYSRLVIMSRFAREFRYCIELEKNIKKQDQICNVKYEDWKNIKVEFKNVSFKYPDTDKLIINNLSLTIQPGETLSIVGVNGAGKTTFVKLLCRLYEPNEGEILINDVPISNIPLDKYYDMLGVVFQDFKLFSFSVKENIVLDTECDENKLSNSIERSGLTDKIYSLTNGVDTSISKQFDDYGVEFSGGEGQKLAIARTLYKDVPLIVLDEPTSALDPIAEYDIYHRFHQLTEGKSTVYISHRLSSTRFTDKIAVFSDGIMVEYGRHRELIQIENGIYKKMFEMQAKYYTRDKDTIIGS